MMFHTNLLLLILTLILNISFVWNVRHLPSYFPRCYRDDPDLHQCLLDATNQVRPYLRDGVPELGMPAIAPFLIPEVTLEQGTQSVDYKAALKNVVVHGLDNYQFKNFRFNIEKTLFTANVTVTDVMVEGDYVVNGKILTVALEGKGRVQVNITEANATVAMQGELKKEKGYTFIIVPKIDVSLNIGNVTYNINGLFEDNEVLVKAVRNVVQNNFRELLEEVKPVIENVLRELLHQMISTSVSKVDYDELYPTRGNPKR